MIKFMVKASLTPEGVSGLLKEGGNSRKRVVEKMIADMGGKMESFYFCFGEYDVISIGELPDEKSLAAVSMAINSTGLVKLSTIILLDPAEVDEAVKKSVNYRGPGM